MTDTATPAEETEPTGFTITSKIPHAVVLGPAGDGQPIALAHGDTVEVSERQAVHALGREDLEVTVPDGYAAKLAALTPVGDAQDDDEAVVDEAGSIGVDYASMTVPELDETFGDTDGYPASGGKPAKVAWAIEHAAELSG